ncbi:MAG: DUF4435 domain-containing protein [Prevotellaceae bacterium]|nr:DUF4435 domain-containing protein [Prevotellaceae bacterium]
MEKDRSLRGNVVSVDKINEIRLSLRSKTGCEVVWVLVEGEDDCKIYSKFFAENVTRVEFVNGGKDQLLIALETLTQETRQVVGIRDADFLHLERNYPSVANLFFTDCHDIEMTMVYSDAAFKNILYEYSLQQEGDEIKQNILTEASFVGYIRYYNELNTCSINFKGIGYNVDFEDNTHHITLDRSCLIQELNQRSPDKKITIDENTINQFAQSKNIQNSYQLVNGHDFIKILMLRIKKTKNNLNVKADNVAISLRNSYQIAHFRETELYSQLLDWQRQNGFTILKAVA